MTGARHNSEAFGLRWRSDMPLPGFDFLPAAIAAGDGLPSVEVRRIDRLPARAGGRPINRGSVHADGIRFVWKDEVAFDMTEGCRVDYRPGPGWTGVMPACFYGTVVALTLAWRGVVPLHASAVELDGAAVLVAGAAGAGKSTLTAGLVMAGARFVSDDLVAASVGADGRIAIARGRPTIRLHPDTAAALDPPGARPVPGDPRGKWLARPPARTAARALAPVAALILAGGEPPDRSPAPGPWLPDHLFRARWLDALPMRRALLRDAGRIAAAVPVASCPPATAFDAPTRARHARDAVIRLRDLRAARGGVS